MKKKLAAPQATRLEHYTNYHNDRTLDPYFWLREKENPQVLQHLKKENAYFQKKVAPYKKTATKIFHELKERIPTEDESVPIRRGDWDYFSRYLKGKQYIQFCRKQGTKIEVLIDFNKLVKKGGYLQTMQISPSYDGQYLAYSMDTKGDEICDIIVMETDTKRIVSHLKKTSGDFAWSTTDLLYYTTLDGHIRGDKVWRHELGQNQSKDALIFHEPDQKFFIGIHASASKKYLIITSEEKVSSYAAFLPLDSKEAMPEIFKKLKENIEYSIDHGKDGFYILTNEKALNFKVYRCPEEKTDQKNWKLIIAHDKKIHIEGIGLTENFLCAFERSGGLPKARIVDLKKKKTHYVKFSEAAYTMSFSASPFHFSEDKIRFSYASPITPKTVFDYDLKSRKQTIRKMDKVKKFQSKKYQVEYVFVSGHDKAKIPLCIISKKTLKKNGKAPTVLYGYGSYGMTIGYHFSSSLISLLDRGFVYAFAGIRGGSDMGRAWYEDGKYLKKKNTFKDFISCAEHLIKKKYTSPDHLAIRGGSAGGLLVGATVNMRPDLFKVVCAHVPFVDLINTMFDDSLPLTQTEYKEWGNPHDKKYYNYMKSYSPYDNVHECAYPHMYITAGLNDQRVTYWEPAKWAQKLRDFNTGENDVLLKINMGEGHFGKSGRYNSLMETAEEYSYLVGMLSK